MSKIKLATVLLMVLVGGCAQRLTDFTVISTKSLSAPLEKGRRVKGEDCGFFSVDMKQAIDNAIESAGEGDVLVDGVLTRKDYVFWACYQVEGNIAGGKKSAVEESGPTVAASKPPEDRPTRHGGRNR